MTKNDWGAVSGLLVLASVGLALPIAIGLLAGAGAGWLIFAVVLFLLALRSGYLAKQEKAKEEKGAHEQAENGPTAP